MNRNIPSSDLPETAREHRAGDPLVIHLPVELRDNEPRLRLAATHLLSLAHVRSVTIDRNHPAAFVRFQASGAIGSGLGTIHVPNAVEPATSISTTDSKVPSVASWIDPRDQSLCFVRLPEQAVGWRRALLLLFAVVTLGLGLIGLALPGLPTTPFILLTSYCLLRTSPGLHARLLHSRLFGHVLRDWYLHRGIRPRVRYQAVAFIALVVGGSLYLASLPIAGKVVLLAAAACGLVYVWRLPDASRGQAV